MIAGWQDVAENGLESVSDKQTHRVKRGGRNKWISADSEAAGRTLRYTGTFSNFPKWLSLPPGSFREGERSEPTNIAGSFQICRVVFLLPGSSSFPQLFSKLPEI
jgi:hypothetical protein